MREQNARLEAAERSLYLKLNEAERERDEAKALLRGLVAGHPDDRAHWQACPACRCAFAEPPA